MSAVDPFALGMCISSGTKSVFIKIITDILLVISKYFFLIESGCKVPFIAKIRMIDTNRKLYISPN